MPIYEYKCHACGTVAEYHQKVSDPAPEACRDCGKGPLSKQMSRTSFVLKGGGWYVTDFRDNGKKPASGGDGSSTSGSAGESKSSSNQESKAATGD